MSEIIWTPDSWRTKVKNQIPNYDDLEELKKVEAIISSFP